MYKADISLPFNLMVFLDTKLPPPTATTSSSSSSYSSSGLASATSSAESIIAAAVAAGSAVVPTLNVKHSNEPVSPHSLPPELFPAGYSLFDLPPQITLLRGPFAFSRLFPVYNAYRTKLLESMQRRLAHDFTYPLTAVADVDDLASKVIYKSANESGVRLRTSYLMWKQLYRNQHQMHTLWAMLNGALPASFAASPYSVFSHVASQCVTSAALETATAACGIAVAAVAAESASSGVHHTTERLTEVGLVAAADALDVYLSEDELAATVPLAFVQSRYDRVAQSALARLYRVIFSAGVPSCAPAPLLLPVVRALVSKTTRQAARRRRESALKASGASTGSDRQSLEPGMEEDRSLSSTSSSSSSLCGLPLSAMYDSLPFMDFISHAAELDLIYNPPFADSFAIGRPLRRRKHEIKRRLEDARQMRSFRGPPPGVMLDKKAMRSIATDRLAWQLGEDHFM